MNKLIIGLIAYLCVMSAWAEAPEKSLECVVCHGPSGVSNNTNWPNLAGQQRDYLMQEMIAFRDGTRVDAAMPAELLNGLSDQQIMKLADYYSGLDAAKPAPVEDGTPGQHVRATCVSCHGMTGNSVTSLWPNLSAQKEAYLKKQLLDYKSGKRSHPIMQVIASELTDQQIAQVAKYYSQH